MRFFKSVGAALGLIGLAGCATITAPDDAAARRAADEIQAVEAAFAADADRLGIVPAFRQRVGPDAILFLPDPTVINPMLETANWPGDLDWRPAFLVVSEAGDLAFTSGPSAWRIGEGVDHGYYFSVWKRQANGQWRFLVDGTTEMAEDLYAEPLFDPTIILPGFAAGAAGDIAALEAELALSPDYRAALAGRLDPQARVLRARNRPATGEAARSLIRADPDNATVRLIDGGVSDSGDLAYGYGELRWATEGQPRRGYFNRVWRRDDQARWRVIYDQMNVRPES